MPPSPTAAERSTERRARGGYRPGKHPVPLRGPSYQRRTRWTVDDPCARRRNNRFRAEWRGVVRVFVAAGALSAECEPLAMALADSSTNEGAGPGVGRAPGVSQYTLGERVQRSDRTVRRLLREMRAAGLVDWIHHARVDEGGWLPLPNEYRLLTPAAVGAQLAGDVARRLCTEAGGRVSAEALSAACRARVDRSRERSSARDVPSVRQRRQAAPAERVCPPTAVEFVERAERVWIADRGELAERLRQLGEGLLANKVDVAVGPLNEFLVHRITATAVVVPEPAQVPP